jgi:hypothetical protein
MIGFAEGAAVRRFPPRLPRLPGLTTPNRRGIRRLASWDPPPKRGPQPAVGQGTVEMPFVAAERLVTKPSAPRP